MANVCMPEQKISYFLNNIQPRNDTTLITKWVSSKNDDVLIEVRFIASTTKDTRSKIPWNQ